MARSRLISKVSKVRCSVRNKVSRKSEGEMRLTLVHLDVNGTPPDVILGSLLIDDTLVLGRAAGLLARKVDEGAR